MYCFSHICRLCLKKEATECANLNEFDNDHVRILEKLKFCVPEIIADDKQLPDTVCCDCRLFLHQAYTFKQMCINNTAFLHDCVQKLSSGYKSKHHYQLELVVEMNELSYDKANQNRLTDEIRPLEGESSNVKTNESQLTNEIRSLGGESSNDKTIENKVKNDSTSDIEILSLGGELNDDKTNINRATSESTNDVEIRSLGEELSNDKTIKNRVTNESTNDVELRTIGEELNNDKTNESRLKEESTNDVDTRSLEGISIFSISLNQWDLFETKHTCRCVKIYNSFTENTSHLCRNCEGELHGFRLSKLKVGIAENRYKNKIGKTNLESDDSSSIVSFDVTSERVDKKYEKGFDYNDFSLSKVHVNEVNKQIDILNSTRDDDDSSLDENSELESEIRNPKPFECPICHKNFTRRYNLFSHYGKHEESIFYFCDQCPNRFIDKEKYHLHLQSHETRDSALQKPKVKNSSPKTEKHISAESTSDEKSDLNQSLNSSSESLTCGTCDQIFERKSKLAMHILSHVGKKEFHCDHCGEGFFRKENLTAHQAVHKLGRKYQCDKCDKSYEYLSNLKRHKAILHEVRRKLKCEQCDKSYNYASNLKRHKMFSHGGQYGCSVCNAKFTEREVLINHIFNTHSKSKTISPKQSKGKLRNDGQPKETVSKSHSDKKETKMTSSPLKKRKFFCKICSKFFSRSSNLKTHEKLHLKNKHKKPRSYVPLSLLKVEKNGQKGLMCPICKQIFSVKTNIRKHIRLHSKEKNNVCSICSEKFASMFALKRHLKTHYLNFKCDICNKAYVTNHSLKRHVEQCHKK